MSPSISYKNEKELMGRSSSSRIFVSGGGDTPPERRSSRAGGCDPPRRSKEATRAGRGGAVEETVPAPQQSK